MVAAGAPAPRDRPAASPAGTQQRPNILFILIDDMGFADPSVTGNRRVATPNIDRLAAEGLLMTQFYDAAPICSPSRAGFFTGRFPARSRFVTYVGSRAQNAAVGQADWLSPGVPTLAQTLHGAGYATGHFGKWHMGGGRDVGDAPLITDYGFDESYTQFEGLGPRVLPSNVEGEMQRLAEQSAAHGRGKVDYLRRGEVSARYIDKTIDFIARHRDRPWFVQLWPDDVHAPWIPDGDQLAPVKGKGRDANEDAFFAVLTAMDRQIGRLVAALRASGELDRTLIVLTSDNGPNSVARFYANGGSPPGSAGIYRGRKDSLYEGGIRQPLIVRWPGQVPARRRDTATIAQGVDLFPTLAAVAGAGVPRGLDGVSLLPAWRGKPIAKRPDLFWTYGAFGPDAAWPRPTLPVDNSPGFAIRSGPWKLLVDGDGRRAELYDIDHDPRETRNLAAARPALTRSLGARLRAWRRALPSYPAFTRQAGKPAAE
ncbi:sulfatase-like hydrolase/transferase [Sphingomonas sp. R-74633]|nr:sulfatase-like hydrolase/transferase [Sphingomonas sp. R-74633]NYT41925.1 sulfatase-like hydrolase/transferase [Sphingomonas sp. R-74633]